MREKGVLSFVFLGRVRIDVYRFEVFWGGRWLINDRYGCEFIWFNLGIIGVILV